jgi:hypothetical protein
MSRPKPAIILEQVNKTTYLSEQILACDGIWAVYYNGQPFNLKTHNILVSYPGPKYKKTAFANPGPAINLCKKLNTRFKTDKFTVVTLVPSDQIYPIVK